MVTSLTDKVMGLGNYKNLGNYILNRTHCIWEMIEARSIPSGIEFPLDTNTQPFINLIENAKKNIRMVQDLDYISDPKIFSALEKSNEKGVRIEIIYKPNQQNQYIDNLTVFLLRNHKNIHLYEIEEIQNYHSILADEKGVGMELPHIYGKLPSGAVIRNNSPFLSKGLRREFIKMKKRATQKF